MAPSWRQEAFSLIDDEWDEEAENLAPSSVHLHEHELEDDEDKSDAPQTNRDEVMFTRAFRPQEATRHARVLRSNNGVARLPLLLHENIAIPPGLDAISVDVSLLADGVEFSHTNFHNVANQLVIHLGSGFEVALWDHFNPEGLGRRVALSITSFSAEGIEEIASFNLPESYATVAAVQKDLQRFLTRNGLVAHLRRAA